MDDNRPDPEQLLKKVTSLDDKKTGKLKIFFGYAAGVGKTYAMLEEAHQEKDKGVDVVAGYIERHTRPDTLALLDGLEQLDNLEVPYKGITLKEFNLDGALARKPQLILVDELAHSNAPGCRHAKRYQDIEELLRAGINVYTTVNVQHLESLNDLVSSITGVTVSERVPDHVFDSADKVEVVDIEPDDLIARLESGKVYREKQAERALGHFFVRENLAALREIALRRTADRLNRTAQKSGNENAARAGEHILICLSGSPSNAKVIRTAARMSEAFHSGFTALFVESSDTKEMKGESLKRLRDNTRLAEQMGAQIVTVYGEDAAVQIAEYARISGVTKIIMGRTNHRRTLFSGKNLADRLIQLTDNLDIYIIPDSQPRYKNYKRFLKKGYFNFNMKDIVKMLLVVILCTLIGLFFQSASVSESNIIIVYILGVLITSVWTNGQLYGAIASLLGVISFNYFFIDPRFTLEATGSDYPITFLIMLAASVISSSLAIRVKKQARQAAQKAYYTELLLDSSQKMQKGREEQDILMAAAYQLSKLLNRPILYTLAKSQDQTLTFSIMPKEAEKDLPIYLTSEEQGVAEWVLKNNKHAGASTNTLPDAKCLYLAVRGTKGVMGIVGIPADKYSVLEAFEKNLMVAILNECGLIIEKKRLGDEKHAMEVESQQERLRSHLLRAISHDLRTPLTSISGNAGVLRENGEVLDEKKKQELYTAIYDDSMWLINLTENLLSVTRIENGTMHLRMQPELIEEVFQEALKHIDRHASDHSITTHLDDEFLMAKMDVRLIIQVIINIVNNAIKYTPAGSHIVLNATKKGNYVLISISDDGPGISDKAKPHIFDMFYTASQRPADDRRGLGLGLSLCKSIVTAHEGAIEVLDNKPCGTIFQFTLKRAEVNTNV